jgi:hypothetical protein
MPPSKNKKVKKISQRVKKRIKKEIEQSGGGPREMNFNSDGNFNNLIFQMGNLMVNTIAGIADGVNATYSIFTLPRDFVSIVDKPGEPLPGNHPVSKIINII